MLFKRLLSAIMMNLMVISGLPAVALDRPMSLSDPKSLRQSAFESYLQGNYDKAKVYYEQAMDQTQKSHGPNSPFLADLYFELGTISLELSKFSVASHYLPLAVEKKPNSLQARLKLVELDMLTGKEEDARAQLDAAQKAHPKSPEVQAAVVKWMIRESKKARKEEGNPQKEQMLAMASVSGSYYLHKLVEAKVPPPHNARANHSGSSHSNPKTVLHPTSQPHKSSMSEGLSRFASPVSEKPAAPKAKEPVTPPAANVESLPPQPQEPVKENPVESALSLKSRVFLQPKKVEEKKAPPPVVVQKTAPKPVIKPPKKEKPKPRVQPPVVAVAKPAKVAKVAPAKHAQAQQMAPVVTGMDMSMMMPSMPMQMVPVGKRSKKSGGMVPPPPPMIPSYSGGMPSMYPSMMQPRLETKARLQDDPPKRKAKAKAQEEQASEAPANSEDPEFILEWASVKKKNKGKAPPKESKDD